MVQHPDVPVDGTIWTGAFWKAAAERAVRTAAISAALVLIGDAYESMQVNALAMDWWRMLGFALGGAILSVLLSVGANAKSGRGPSFSVETVQEPRRALPPESTHAARRTVNRRWVVLAALTLTLLAGGTAQAQPPPASLCPGLTGDALTRCLYSALDDRLRGLGSVPTTAPTTAPPTTAPPATGDWLSGVAGREGANGTFDSWRGTPVEIATFWVNDTPLYPIGPPISGCGDCGMWANLNGPVSISATAKTWQGWAAEANGANDTYWTTLARKARELRANKGQVYINPYYEFNGDWMPYSVARTAQGQADFVKAFARTSAILRREFPGVQVVINPAAGRTVPTEMWPANSAFDVVGIDTYNEWPHCATASCQGTQISRIETIRLQAAARGKPIAFPEWGNSAVAASAGGGGESPAFIDALHSYLAEHAGTGAGQVVYETYFNIGGYTARYELYINGQVNPLQPQTAARYRERF